MKMITKIAGAVTLAATLATAAVVPAQAQSFSFGFGVGNGGMGYHNGGYWNDGPRWHHRGDWRWRDHGRYYRPRGGVSFSVEVPVRSRSTHVARCEARYRSYDWRSDTYLGYDGDRHLCRL